MAYKCFSCGRTIQKEKIEQRIICPYCNGRVIFKTREGPRKVRAV